ncbi:cupin domain-containing protein [Halalkalicoccus jeotgali]|uniref:Cupin 2 barrel domain-containing protein n=1 Tax=Halalkalicoccus jeotgali (strain DSM 18796 / CECT 7217 / JCM 14584 / KCTC 4019 / B3) TaxID=795797 RepID=D8J4I3_HALJB|nr:cupin domain-containing protein [Halalkalicoccus jeotgali]ADJ13545.1 Cupin 2 conserved barrel domain protein [Halalkalicoccus jeotgali B3]ELY32980.1 Cupin 2 barrel domain-containing protein [Halalkalicoccus jeotgali B3]
MDRVNATELEWSELDHGDTRFRRKQLAEAADGEGIGCSLYELPPGSRSWPYHYHTGNEEAIYVLSGTGVLRDAEGNHDLRAGEYVALPVGEEGAHRVINDSEGPLRYLAISTMRDPDVTVYPDAGAIGVFAGSPPGGHEERTVEGFFEREDAHEFWDLQS